MSDAASPSRPRLLDLFCGAGGAARGYHRAGFDVVGVDLAPQPNYPFRFIRAAWTAVARNLRTGEWFADVDEGYRVQLGHFDVIHASPPCQGYTQLAAVNAKLGRKDRHAKLIAETRARLEQTGLAYVIESVVGAPLIDPVRVCGTSFNRPLRRHRLFESNLGLVGTPCQHGLFTEPKYWTGWRPGGKTRLSTVVQVYGNAADKHLWPDAMGIDWMTYDEIAEAVPPDYTEFIGAQLLSYIEAGLEVVA